MSAAVPELIPHAVYFWNPPSTTSHGGGFHFLAALQRELEGKQLVTPELSGARIILVDSYHDLASALTYKRRHPSTAFVLRFGPIFQLHRAWFWKYIDQIMILAANYFADLVIFQSQWSLQQAVQLGFRTHVPHTIIYNGVDPAIFYPATTKKASVKIKLVATSWSSNTNKGFPFLQYLDEYLDWNKYEMAFIGNSPVQFQHIKNVAALTPDQLAQQLRARDIYIAGMRDDACSNALLEAIACGLPIVALNSGANPELISPTDSLFAGTADLIPAIKQIKLALQGRPKTIQTSAAHYAEAIENLPMPHGRIHLWYYLKALGLHTLFYVFQNLSSFTAR